MVGNGTSTFVDATVLDGRGLPTRMDEGETFVAHLGEEDWVLELRSDENGDPTYRAELPFLAQYADVDLRYLQRGIAGWQSFASIRLDAPFTIASAPTELRVGEDLAVDFRTTTTSPSGRPFIALEGDCVAPMAPAFLQTYGSVSSARFDTTNLPVTGGGCDVTATIMFVNERVISAGGNTWDTSRAPPSKGIQQRTLVFHLTE